MTVENVSVEIPSVFNTYGISWISRITDHWFAMR